MHLSRSIIVFAVVILHPANALAITQHHDDATKAQLALEICPQLKVNCVLDGDWRHPVGTLGKKRQSRLSVAAPSSRTAMHQRQCNSIEMTDRCDFSQRSAAPVYGVTSATNRTTRTSVIGHSGWSVEEAARRTDRYPFEVRLQPIDMATRVLRADNGCRLADSVRPHRYQVRYVVGCVRGEPNVGCTRCR